MYDPLPVLEGAMRNPLPWLETMGWDIIEGYDMYMYVTVCGGLSKVQEVLRWHDW